MDDGHERREIAEEAEGQIGQCGNTEDSGLGHTTRVPRYEDRCHSGTVLTRAGEKTRLVALALILLPEHVGREDDRDILVARHEIHGDTVEDCSRDKSDTCPDHAPCNSFKETAEHAASCQGSTENHGRENKPDGIEHARHATCRHKTVEQGDTCADRGARAESEDNALEER